MATETLDYTVVEKDGKFEIRDYASYTTAEVVVEDSYNSALLKGFRILADYIFGNNRSKQHIAMTSPVMQSNTKPEKIEMTAPVLAQKHTGNAYLVSFILPKKYSIETAPEPVSENIGFRVGASNSLSSKPHLKITVVPTLPKIADSKLLPMPVPDSVSWAVY